MKMFYNLHLLLLINSFYSFSSFCIDDYFNITYTDINVAYCGHGRIGNGRCLDSSKCCSNWGYCGTSHRYCNNSVTKSNTHHFHGNNGQKLPISPTTTTILSTTTTTSTTTILSTTTTSTIKLQTTITTTKLQTTTATSINNQNSLSCQLIKATNDHRIANGKSALQGDTRLNNAAYRTCLRVTTCSHPSEWASDMIDAGYSLNSAGQNLDCPGNIIITPIKAVQDWTNSPDHEANQLGDYQNIGVAMCQDSFGNYWWLQDFASGDSNPNYNFNCN
jgi:uncharacterized protein YkwD